MEMHGARNFSDGLLGHYEKDLKKVQQSLNELTNKQVAVLSDIEKDNLKFASINMYEMNALFVMMKEYQTRLHNIKKEMIHLAEKSNKLKKRALRLQEKKQKEALEDAHYREAQLKREQDLIARPSSSPQ